MMNLSHKDILEIGKNAGLKMWESLSKEEQEKEAWLHASQG